MPQSYPKCTSWKHVSNWLEKWNVGLGFMGEQGAESIHASFNNIERSYLNMPNKVELPGKTNCVIVYIQRT